MFNERKGSRKDALTAPSFIFHIASSLILLYCLQHRAATGVSISRLPSKQSHQRIHTTTSRAAAANDIPHTTGPPGCQFVTARIPVSASLSWQEMRRRELIILLLVVSNPPVVTWPL